MPIKGSAFLKNGRLENWVFQGKTSTKSNKQCGTSENCEGKNLGALGPMDGSDC